MHVLENSNIEHKREVQQRPNEYDKGFGRHLRPRFLCVIDDSPGGYSVCDVDDWDKHRSETISGGYVFVSYTRAQFYPPDEVLNELVAIGKAAAKRSGLQAFWIDYCCLPLHDNLAELQDSHRISDITRGAYQMVIAVRDAKPDANSDLDRLLGVWASRLWTLPELLLAPTRRDIDIYFVRPGNKSSTTAPVEKLTKLNMAERAYIKDGNSIRQLVDHFEGSLHLT